MLMLFKCHVLLRSVNEMSCYDLIAMNSIHNILSFQHLSCNVLLFKKQSGSLKLCEKQVFTVIEKEIRV